MSCRRCSTCGISYPLTVSKCLVCDDTTDYLSNVDPDRDWQHAADLACADRPSAEEQKLRGWRREILAGLGFNDVLLEMLVEQETDLGLARRLVENGCPTDLAANILY